MRPAQIHRLLAKVFPRRSVKNLQPLSGGLINTNIRVDFETNHEPVVLRLYRNGAEVCRKELAIHHLLSRTIRVPRVVHAEPEGIEDLPAFLINEYVIGSTFGELKRAKNLRAIQQASHSVGATLAVFGGFNFEKPGRFEMGKDGALKVGPKFIEGPNQLACLTDMFLASANCERRAGSKLVQRLRDYVWSWSSRLPDLEESPCLVHNDFGNRNILVRQENG